MCACACVRPGLENAKCRWCMESGYLIYYWESEWAPPDYVREHIKKSHFQCKGAHQNIAGA